jgi:hypothetical protein
MFEVPAQPYSVSLSGDGAALPDEISNRVEIFLNAGQTKQNDIKRKPA